jgi:hypothetical protein
MSRILNNNNQALCLTDEDGSLEILGSQNKIELNNCIIVVTINGSENTITMKNSQVNVSIAGNGTCVNMTNSSLRIEVNGNGNEVGVADNREGSVQVIKNSGSFNSYPSSAKFLPQE